MLILTSLGGPIIGDQIYFILETAMNVFYGVITFAFAFQIIYLLFFFVKPKKYKKAQKYHRFGIVIPARNESKVIEGTINCIKELNYPKDMFDIFVVADNCTDNTAELARNAGAIVYVHNNPDKKTHNAGHGLQYLFDSIMKDYPGKYEAFIKFDADNHMNKDYISLMNDAFDSGVKSARGYSNGLNIGQNVLTGISGLWYIRDCRFSCNFRSAINSSQMLGGAGMMFASSIIETHGWDCLSNSDDTEFALKRLNNDRIKTMYVSEAEVYEDEPSTFKDTYNKYKRIGKGLHKMFYSEGLKCLLHFFTRWHEKYSYLDMFVNMLFIPINVLFCLWLPSYYAYAAIYLLVINTASSMAALMAILQMAAISLSCVFALTFILQALFAVILEHKRINVPFSRLILPILLFPFFMIIYAFSITIGVLTKPKWKGQSRSVKVENKKSI